MRVILQSPRNRMFELWETHRVTVFRCVDVFVSAFVCVVLQCTDSLCFVCLPANVCLVFLWGYAGTLCIVLCLNLPQLWSDVYILDLVPSC